MSINTLKTVLTTCIVALGATTHAQDANAQSASFTPCAATEYSSYLKSKNIGQTTTQFESWLAPKLSETATLRSGQSTNQVVSLPVVIHIIHDGDEVGISENIPDARILSQLQVLNEDFRRIQGTPGYVEGNAGTDMEIEFCLAQQDPDGNPTTGITRHNLGKASWNSMEAVDEEMKPATAWDPTRYINIWVCRFGGQLAQVGGYAYFPEGSGLDGLDEAVSTASIDGLAMSFKAFGTSDVFPAASYFPEADKGRSASHEMGHYFGLRHIWGDENSCSATDFCDDTPAVSGVHTSCTPADTCPDSEGADQIENHMDYTPDACKSIFTAGQKARMWTVLQNSPRRTSLLTSNGCQAPTAGVNGHSLNSNGTKLYPNPVNDELHITAGSALPQSAYVVYNILGAAVLNGSINAGTDAVIDTTKLTQGVYIVTITAQNQSRSLRFIKE
ncbi:M43 family zinc metalloprotease [Flavobacterium zepuense]|nr:M43 family zinc metalloprotease [Flavobacterium zepuense]